jgi:chromosome segregation ATPase
MAFLNGTDERRAAEDGESAPSTPDDDVTITIRGHTAAKMLGRGDAESRILEELGELRHRLDSMEVAAVQRVAQHQALGQAVQGLQEKVAHLGGQVAQQVTELRTEVSRLRTDLGDQSFRAAHLPGKIDQVHGQIELLQHQVGPLQDHLGQLQTQLAALERTVAPPATADANGEASASNRSWLKQRLNFLGLW